MRSDADAQVTSVLAMAPDRPAERPRAIEPGMRIGHYEIVRELGRGGMGAVFLARDTKLGRRVALKFLLGSDPDLNQRFAVEARATARFQHENIVVIHEVGEHAGHPYMVLEYLEGESLASLLRGGVLPPARSIELIIPVVAALTRAHAEGIVHRDLKPANIFVTSGGAIKVLDFGIAKLFGEAPQPVGAVDWQRGSEPGHELTATGQVVGTLPFMAPEQWAGDRVDHRTDLYAVGILLYRMVTGRHPVTPPNAEAFERAARDLDHPHPSVGQARAGLPPRLIQVIDRCIAKRAGDRFADAAELLRDLEAQRPRALAQPLGADDCPYPGLTSFEEADAARFFGRARDVARALTRVRENPLTTIVGVSGAGKSSFVRAGIVPALHASGEPWQVLVLRPGRSPLASLVAAVDGIVEAGADSAIDDARLRAESGSFGAALRARARGARFLIFVDQYEELWTLAKDPVERAAFNACLAAAADDAAAPIRVVLSLRSDFLDRVADDPHLGDQVVKGLFFLGPPGRDALHDALVSPAELYGYRFEASATIEHMLDGLEITPAALPVLQFTAARLWEHRDRERKLLCADAYEAIGGIAGALAGHADQVLAELAPADQRLARVVLLQLVTTDGTRATVELDELRALASDPDAVMRLVDRLAAARLVVVHSRDDGAVVELVHDSLTTAWPRLRRWREESQEDAALLGELRVAAKQWDARGRTPGSLWRDEALDEARRFHARYRGELAERERAFLAAALGVEVRAARRRRILIGVFVAMLGIGAVAATIALIAIRRAEQTAQHQAGVAHSEAERARSAELQIKSQLDQVQAAERKRQEAETKASQAGHEVEMTHVELESAYEHVQHALTDAEAARVRAERSADQAKHAAERAEQANVAERKARAEAEQLLAKERERLRKMERDRGRIQSDL